MLVGSPVNALVGSMSSMSALATASLHPCGATLSVVAMNGVPM
jgi:hypothetical protein